MPKVALEIEKITIIRPPITGPDRVNLHTTLPSGTYPCDATVTFSCFVARGGGRSYCEKHFPGVPVEEKE